MNLTRPTGQLPPEISNVLAYSVIRGETLRSGAEDDPPNYITNGPATLVYFTDQAGNRLQTSPQCVLDPEEADLPPCDLAVGLDKNKFTFALLGTVSSSAKLGHYTFYVRVENMVGKSNVCTCRMEVALHPRTPPV